MRFVDEVRIHVRAGHGGRGSSSFHRAKFVPLGGPDGGDGGHGGSVILRATTDLGSLLDLQYQQHYTAASGAPGGRSQRTGASGEDLIVAVPVGTVALDLETGACLGDLTSPDQEMVVARGGKGGRGNLNFVSSTNRAPTRYDEGQEGEVRELLLELRLMADVGLVGLPNAGKSTLISRISAARPKIGDYPFTTLVPNLGVVRVDTDRAFVVADIPGLIEGASQGAGLGLQFLRHIRRTRILLHLVSLSDMDEADPEERFAAINRELEQFDPEILLKRQVVVLSRIDACSDREDRLPETVAHFAGLGYPVYPISAITGEGVQALVYRIARILGELEEAEAEENRHES